MKTKASAPSPKKIASGKPAAPLEQTSVTKKSATPNKEKSAVVVAKTKVEQLEKAKSAKEKQCTFSLTESEYDAVQELRHKVADALDRKVKKSELLRVAVRILLNQTPAKVKAELAKAATD